MNKDTLVLLLIFQNVSYYFRIMNVHNFQISKVQPQGVAQHERNFCQFQLGIAYKSFVYKKKAFESLKKENVFKFVFDAFEYQAKLECFQLQFSLVCLFANFFQSKGIALMFVLLTLTMFLRAIVSLIFEWKSFKTNFKRQLENVN